MLSEGLKLLLGDLKHVCLDLIEDRAHLLLGEKTFLPLGVQCALGKIGSIQVAEALLLQCCVQHISVGVAESVIQFNRFDQVVDDISLFDYLFLGNNRDARHRHLGDSLFCAADEQKQEKIGCKAHSHIILHGISFRLT